MKRTSWIITLGARYDKFFFGHPYVKIVQNLHLVLTGKNFFYTAQIKRELEMKDLNLSHY
jgi:hypothetical protein